MQTPFLILGQAGLGALFTAGGLAAAGAAAVAIPVAIHLLTRMKRNPEPWAAMRFLLEAYRKQRRRLQMEQWLLLAIRCLIVAVLGMALAGPLINAATWGLAGGSGRVVYLVIDDSLGAQAGEMGSTRFDQEVKAALRIVANMQQGDQVAIGLAARPVKWVVEPTSADLAGAEKTLKNLKVRYSDADWAGVLSGIAEEIKDKRADPGRTHVVLLSGFMRAGVDPDKPLAGAYAVIGQHAKLWGMPPSGGGLNAQVSEVRPFRKVIFAGDPTGGSLPVEVKLSRFGPDLPGVSQPIRVALSLPGAKGPSVTADRTVTWFPGQTQAGVTLDLDLSKDPTPGARVLTAQVETGAGQDLILADNIARALLTMKSRPAGMIVDGPVVQGPDLAGRQWLTLALSPAPGYGVESQLVDPQAMTEELLKKSDVVYVLRPDLINEQGFNRLAAFARRGGLVVVFPPESMQPMTWGARMVDAFKLDWRIAQEPVQTPGYEDREAGWGLNLTDAAPGAARLLAGDWPELLRPVRVRRYLNVETPDTAAVRWIRIDAPGNPGLLMYSPVGDGAVLMWAVAPVLPWTNLPARPGFLPIVQETMRGLLSSLPGSGELVEAAAGTLTAPGKSWTGATAFEPVADPAFSRDPVKGQAAVPLRPTDEGPVASVPLDVPGVYEGKGNFGSSGGGRYAAVNVVASAGDTRPAGRQQVQAWSKPMAAMVFFDLEKPEAVLESPDASLNLGWPLLWVVLALVLAETFVARLFSHASQALANAPAAGAGQTLGRPKP
jgi:hypothetical protein